MKKKISFTNVIIVLAIIVYILNIFVVSPDTGSMSLQIIESLKSSDLEITPIVKLMLQIFGFWGGHVNDLLGFQIDKVFHGEIWRIYTVILTHSHLPHIVMNLIALLFAGNHIEKKIGTKKIIILFLLLTAINDFATDFIYFYLLGNDIALSTGASGWVTTLIGMIVMKCILDKGYYKNELNKGQRIYLIIYFITTTFVLMPNLFTISAHMLGLIVGMIVEFMMNRFSKEKKSNNALVE